MKQLCEILSPPVRQPPRHSRTWRRGSQFVRDTAPYHCRLDRNQRAKLLHFAETVERFSKLKGRRNGLLGPCGLILLRTLVMHCIGANGLLCPSYDRLQRLTGFSKSTIGQCLRRLETLGVLRRTRRLKRRQIVRSSPIHGGVEQIITTTQDSTLLTLTLPETVSGNLWRIPELMTPAAREITQGVYKMLFGRPLRTT